MKKITYFVSIVSVVSMTMMLLGVGALGFAGPDNSERKIVVFENGVSAAEKDNFIKKNGGEKIKDLPHSNGAVVIFPKNRKIEKENWVARVENDVVVNALATASEVLPWGVDKIDAEKSWAMTTGATIKIAVIDTGIDLSHPDLSLNIKKGYNAINPAKSSNDDNGHGTHVAGIIGAVDNTIGVIGVSPKAELYSVKVLDRRGSGYVSDIIEGIDWAIQNGAQVTNMSLGTTQNVLSLHEAIQRAHQAGIVQVAAAGNNGGAVNYPAAYEEVIAVSATDQNNLIASWSSRGAEIDLAAPGVSIYSTYKGLTYKTLSGTSMAAPHIAGSAALVLSRPVSSGYDLNLNSKWDPVEVKKKLQDSAVDLGGAGFDNLYGFGLANVYQAIQ